MKLLLCAACRDLVPLREEERVCRCGRTTGRYLDDRHAEARGEFVGIGINSADLIGALALRGMPEVEFVPIRSWVIPERATTLRRLA